MLILTYLPAFITTVFRGMPGVWKGQHRLVLCWLIVMQAVYPGRKTLHELARWSPHHITEWRLRRLLKASYWSIHLNVEWLAHDVIATLPPPDDGMIFVAMAVINPSAPATTTWSRKAAIPSTTTTGFSVSDLPC
jgi:hypothetical protein